MRDYSKMTVYTQTEARKEAKRLNEEEPISGPFAYVATTICADRGQHEQGPDANKWIIVALNPKIAL